MTLFVRRRWPKVLAAVAVLGVVALVVVMATRDTSPGPTAPLTEPDVQTADPVPEPSPDLVAFDTVLSTNDFAHYEGFQVSATSVKVLAVVGPSAAWVGTSAGKRVLLVLVNATEPLTVKAGDSVTFTGTVQRAGPGVGRGLGLSGADAAAFDKQGGYVEVSAVAAG